MAGETDLRKLLRSMSPELCEGEFAFCAKPPVGVLGAIHPLMTFEEAEGTTAIIRLEDAKRFNLPFQFPCRRITLHVHSSLDAIGFLAIITKELAAHGLSMNAVSAYFHDHLFVPIDRAEEALEILHSLSMRNEEGG